VISVNIDLKIESFPHGDKKSGEHYTIRQTVNALYTRLCNGELSLTRNFKGIDDL